jgi:hypothetical protein
LINDKASDLQTGNYADLGYYLLFENEEYVVPYNFNFKRIRSLADALPLLNSMMLLREAP